MKGLGDATANLVNELVSKLVGMGGSDLDLKLEALPADRLRGLLQCLEDYEAPGPVDTGNNLQEIVPKKRD